MLSLVLAVLAIPPTVTGAYLIFPVVTAVHMPVTASGVVDIALLTTSGVRQVLLPVALLPRRTPTPRPDVRRKFTLLVVRVTGLRLTIPVTVVRAAPREPIRLLSGDLVHLGALLEPPML